MLKLLRSNKSYTKRFIYYRKSVLHLLKRIFHVRLADAVQICGKFRDTQYIVKLNHNWCIVWLTLIDFYLLLVFVVFINMYCRYTVHFLSKTFQLSYFLKIFCFLSWIVHMIYGWHILFSFAFIFIMSYTLD